MILKGLVKDIDTVDEKYRGHYKKDDSLGVYVLQEVDFPDDVPDVQGLLSTVKKLRNEKKEIEDKFKGVDLDELISLRKEKEDRDKEAELKGKSEDEKITLITERLRKTYEDEKEGLKTELAGKSKIAEDAVSKYETYMIKNELRNGAREARVRKEFWDDIALRSNQFRVFEENGSEVVRPIDSDGTPKRSIRKPSEVMTISEWYEVEGKDRPGWFEESGGGSGSPGRRGAAATVDRDNHRSFAANAEEIAKGSKSSVRVG